MSSRFRIVVGLSGAFGAVLGLRVVELLAETGQCDVNRYTTASASLSLPARKHHLYKVHQAIPR